MEIDVTGSSTISIAIPVAEELWTSKIIVQEKERQEKERQETERQIGEDLGKGCCCTFSCVFCCAHTHDLVLPQSSPNLNLGQEWTHICGH